MLITTTIIPSTDALHQVTMNNAYFSCITETSGTAIWWSYGFYQSLLNKKKKFTIYNKTFILHAKLLNQALTLII